MLQPFLNPPAAERRRSRLRAAYGLVAAVAGDGAARKRQWASRLYMVGLVAAIGGSYCYASVRGNNIARQVVLNTRGLECMGVLAPHPKGYKPPMGMPPPSTAPCTVRPLPAVAR